MSGSSTQTQLCQAGDFQVGPARAAECDVLGGLPADWEGKEYGLLDNPGEVTASSAARTRSDRASELLLSLR